MNYRDLKYIPFESLYAYTGYRVYNYYYYPKSRRHLFVDYEVPRIHPDIKVQFKKEYGTKISYRFKVE